jgi:3-methylcrotonyl-CoA carboxylase alpha subunit
MEMNTRLQVEHPVTEMITGLDLVEWQLRVASGEPLPLSQEQLSIDGHALEARIYAEDPDKGFLPSTGRLLHLAPPPESGHVRVDSGVEQGDEITPHYDPMIAKLIVWGADRAQALSRMRQALAQFRVVGVQNNVEFLARLVALPAFAQGRFDTGLIEREQEQLFPAGREVPEHVWQIATLAELMREQGLAQQAARHGGAGGGSPWGALDGWRLNGRAQRRLQLRLGEQVQTVVVEALPRQAWRIALEGAPAVEARATPGTDGALLVQLGERRLHAAVIAAGERRHVFFEGRSWPLSLVDSLHVGGGGDEAEGGLRAPMPGKVIAWLAQPGTAVDKGAPLLVLEAMKMEHTITAPRAGVVKAFRYAPGEQVSDGVELVEFGEAS